MKAIEKRKYMRLSHAVNVKCKIGDEKSTDIEIGECKNISPGGLCLVFGRPIKKSTILYMEIPIKNKPSCNIKGEVLWVKKLEADSKSAKPHQVMAGIKILDMTEENKNRFLLELCDKMVGKLSKKYPQIKF